MADSKWSEQKEEHRNSKSKSCQQRRKWKEQLGNPTEITDKTTEKIIYSQQDINSLWRKKLMQY